MSAPRDVPPDVPPDPPAAYICNECGYCQNADAPHATTTACHACHMRANWSPLYREQVDAADVRARVLEDVTDDEATALDRWMDDHMHGHAVSNSPGNWSCDTSCRTQALRRGVNRMLRLRERDRRTR